MKIIKALILMWILCFPIFGQALEQVSPLRLGWQIPWATQGQLVMGLKHTNILDSVDLEVDYFGFSYGGPLNKAALAGEVDVLLTADQPALVLLSRNPNFRIVARMMYNRVCVYVPPGSPITSLNQLSQKVVMGPVGAAAERVAISAISRSGVDIQNIRLGQMDMAQQNALLAGDEVKNKWPGVDALFGFDPTPAILKESGKVRMLNCGKVVSVVIAHRDMLEQRHVELVAFLKAFKMSWHYFSTSPETLNRLFSRDSRLNVSDEVLDDAASIEPNRWVESYADLRFNFIAEDITVFEETNQFLLDKGIIKTAVDVEQFIDLGLVEGAATTPSEEELAQIAKSDSGN